LFTLGRFLKITKVARIFGLLLPTDEVVQYFYQKLSGATFWAIFFKHSSGHPDWGDESINTLPAPKMLDLDAHSFAAYLLLLK
jgi:hypothetical protein